MNDSGIDAATVNWEHLIGLLLSAAFGAWAWVVKSFGSQHMASMREIALEAKSVKADLADLRERMRVLEYALGKRNQQD